MDYSLLVAYILAIVLFLGTPGPVTILVINASMKAGFWAGFKTLIGSNAASLILITLSFLMLQGVFSVSETSLNWLTLVGGFYLLYFSVGILREKGDPQINVVNTPAKISRNHFKDGFLISISNPKDILFFVAFFPLFLNTYPQNRIISMVLLLLVWVLLDYALLSLYALLFSKITHTKTIHLIGKISGSVLLLIALYAIWKMVNALFIL